MVPWMGLIGLPLFAASLDSLSNAWATTDFRWQRTLRPSILLSRGVAVDWENVRRSETPSRWTPSNCSARVLFGAGPTVRRGSLTPHCSARVSDPAETADRRSPPIWETFARSGGSVRDRPQRGGNRDSYDERDRNFLAED